MLELVPRKACCHPRWYSAPCALEGDPLPVKDSFWGEYEAGIITGPDSKVERIVRYDVERLPNHNGEQNSRAIAIDPGVVVWERTKHKILGIPFENQNWVLGPSEDYDPEDVTWRAELLDDGKGPGGEVKRRRASGTFQGMLKRFGGVRISRE